MAVSNALQGYYDWLREAPEVFPCFDSFYDFMREWYVPALNKAHEGGRPYKDLWIGLGSGQSKVYRLEVSEEDYLTYTSDQAEKVKIEQYIQKYGSRRKAIEILAEEMRKENRK